MEDWFEPKELHSLNNINTLRTYVFFSYLQDTEEDSGVVFIKKLNCDHIFISGIISKKIKWDI